MADTNLGTAVLRTGLDASGLRTGLQQVGQQITSTATRAERDFARIGASFTRTGKILSVAVTAPLVAFGVASIRAASDAEETASKFATVFRDIGDDAERAADRLGQSFGLSSTNARRLLGDTGDLLTGFGFAQDAALELSVGVNELAVDLASFTNFSGGAEGASAALTKALLGETESLKSLGIAIRQSDVEAKVLQLTQQGLTFETDRQARAYATLAIAQEQSGNAIGDYARTSQSFANQTRGLGQDLNELSVTIGQRILPVATDVVRVLRSGVQAFTDLNPGVQTAAVVIGGLAAAAGPLLLVLGQIVTVIPRITAGLAVLRTAGLAAVGPAGWIALGVIAVGSLAVKLAGDSTSDGPSLRDALATANDAAAQVQGYDDLEGALDSVATTLTGRVKTAFEVGRDQIRLTVQEAEDAGAKFGQIVGALDLAQRATDSGPIRRALESAVFTDGRGSALTALLTAITSGDAAEADRVIELASFGLDDRSVTLLEAFRADLRSVFAAVPARTPPPALRPPPSQLTLANGTQPSLGALRTVGDVFDEVAAAGTALNRIAAFEGTPEAVLAALEGRFALLDGAVREVLTDFADSVTDAELANLRARRDAVAAEIARVSIDIERATGPASDVAIIGQLDAPLTRAQRALSLELGRLIDGDNLGELLGPKVETANSDIALISEEIDLGPLGSALRREADRLSLVIDRTEAQLAAQLAGAAETVDLRPAIARNPAAQADGTAAARDLIEARNAVFVNTISALIESGAPLQEVQDALAQLRALSPEAARQFDSLAISLFDAATAAGSVASAVRIPIPGVTATVEPDTSLRGIFGPATGSEFRGLFDEAGNQIVDAGEFSAEETRAAGQSFALSVAQAGAQFTVSLVDSIRNGDVGGAFQAALGAAGSVGGALASFGPAAGLISSAAAGPLGLIAAILPIVGSLFGGLFGGRRQTEQQERQAEEAQRRQRSTPSIQITANVTQQNTFGTDLVDPRTRAALDAQTRDIVGEVLRQVGFADIRRAALGAPT